MATTAYFPRGPLAVTSPTGRVEMFFDEAQNPRLSTSFVLRATQAGKKVIVRLAVGCAKMNDDDKSGMADFFVEAFQGFGGVVFTGATRDLKKDGAVDLMGTELAGIVSTANAAFGARAMGTAPRVGRPFLKGLNSTFVLAVDEWGGEHFMNPAMNEVMIVQDGPDNDSGWDGDLGKYFAMMDALRNDAGWNTGLIVWNGGGVVMTEAIMALRRKYPVIVIAGSGRAADEIVKLAEAKDADFISKIGGEGNLSHIIPVQRGDVAAFRNALVANGFVTEAN